MNKLSLCLLSLSMTFVAVGCAADPSEQRIDEQVASSEATAANAAGFFKFICPWGSFYRFCSEADQRAAKTDLCDLAECSYSSSDCVDGIVTEYFDCQGELVPHQLPDNGTCAQR
jgi:hypothetical protein